MEMNAEEFVLQEHTGNLLIILANPVIQLAQSAQEHFTLNVQSVMVELLL
jgi:hypothetical protein